MTDRNPPEPGGAWPAPPPPPAAQLRIWTQIGFQSFGGGQATQLLVYDAFVQRRGWMTAAEYSEAWALCQLPPGINLLALATIIGWRQDRAAGVLWALLGLVVPSATVTVLFTIAFALVSGSPLTAIGLRGVVAAVAGMSLVTTVRIATPPLRASAAASRLSLAASLLVLLGAAACYLLLRPPVVLMFVGAGVVLAFIRWLLRKRQTGG